MMCVSPQTQLLAFDKELPNRNELLDAELMSKQIGGVFNFIVTNCEILRAKYQVNHSLRVLYKVVANEKEHFVSARIYAKTQTTEFHIFPNDRKIKNLNVLKGNLVAYAPEKCATAECCDANGEIYGYAKLYAEKEWETGKRVCTFLMENSENNFPKLLAFDEKNRFLILEAVKGKRLADLDKVLITKAFRLFGKAVAEFHGISTSIKLPEFSRLSPNRVRIALQIISSSRPDCKNQAEKLAEKLLETYSFATEKQVVLHGDVHPKNGILRDDGSLMLIDFDQLSYGNPAAEIGSFLAGLHYKEIIGLDSCEERRQFCEAFLQGYSEIRNLPSQKSLNWHTAAALLTERASRSISRIRVEGLQNFPNILETSEQILAGGMK